MKYPVLRTLLGLSAKLPSRYRIHANPQERPVFIFGSGRNGSTLVNRILNQHSQLFLPTEQYFLGPGIFRFHFYNYLPWKKLMEVTLKDLKRGSHTWKIDFEKLMYSVGGLKKEEQNLQSMIRAVWQYASGGPVMRWGDSTLVNVHYLPELYRVFPQAYFVFLIRDGRDVVASFKNGGQEAFDEYSDPPVAAKHWMRCIEAYDWLSNRTKVSVVRYEHLVTNPEFTLRELCRFLEILFEPAMLDFHKHIPETEFFSLGQHQGVRKPVFADSVGNFESRLSTPEVERVTAIMRKGLKRFAYL